MFKKSLIGLFVLILLLPFFLVYIGNVDPPVLKASPLTEDQIRSTSQFYNKDETGVHQVFLNGSDYERGQQYGFWTKDFLFKQEAAMVSKLDQVLPKWMQYGIFFFSMGWFHGLDDYFKQEWVNEMYGVSHYGSKENLYFATPFTRQMAYHGIHDMGQMMIDQGLVLGACTQAAIPRGNGGWLIGRNFDFEAGKVFDEDKVLKWVFPDKGIPFVSVIFSGMVGVITGINQKGVYIAINAAGSEDRVRLGTPATLVLLDALQFSNTAEEAVENLKKAHPLITDIYVVADDSDTLYVVEKSPHKTRVLEEKKANVTTNHLRHPDWQDDEVNNKRINDNTTLARYTRALQLLPDVDSPLKMARLLRDKIKYKDDLAWGHRASIDAMIASHAVVFDSSQMHLYISTGPSLSGKFTGVDLKKSFEEKKPVLIDDLPPDSDYPENKNFYEFKSQLELLAHAREEAIAGHCEKAQTELSEVNEKLFEGHYYLPWAKAHLALCNNDKSQAKDYFFKALKREPAYLRERTFIENEIKAL